MYTIPITMMEEKTTATFQLDSTLLPTSIVV